MFQAGVCGIVLFMRKSDAVSSLARYAGVFRQCGATAAYLYGSRARGDHRPDSDADVFIDYDPDSKIPDLFELIDIEARIGIETGYPVSITTRQALHPLMRSKIEHECVRLF